MQNYLKNKVLNDNLKTVYVGLLTDASTEVTAESYQRVAVTFTSSTTGEVKNTAAVTFAKALQAWGNVTHIGIYDNATKAQGNALFIAEATAAKQVDKDAQYSIPKDMLVITIN